MATIVHVFVVITSPKIINTLKQILMLIVQISVDNTDCYRVDAASVSIDSEGLPPPCVNTPKVPTCHCTQLACIHVYLLNAPNSTINCFAKYKIRKIKYAHFLYLFII